MATINEIKEQMTVVHSVGDFAGALQQIATLRMVRLREGVLRSRPFVEEANKLLEELGSIKNAMDTEAIMKLEDKYESLYPTSSRFAVVIITSNQGLTGMYNQEIFKKAEKVIADNPDADYFVIGHKGQEYFSTTAAKKYHVEYYPYEVPDTFTMQDLEKIVSMFDYYLHVTLVYSRYINSATREVVAISVVSPQPPEEEDPNKKPGKYIFEPDIEQLIKGVSSKLRAALFQQQVFDARLAQNAAQMIGMKTASDNATKMLGDLQLDYNKQRRKMIDKKISEVFAGSSLW